MPLLDLKGITKEYKLGKTIVRALRGLDLEIDRGEVVAIMGPSGSGKSTLMHILGALDTPTGGSAAIDGRDLLQLKERQLVTLRGERVGFVFQTFNLIQTLSAQRNVELPMIFQGTPSGERHRRALQLLEKVGLGDRVRHKPSELSGGERQRVAIARALANDPEIILADEPTGNLDTETGRPILALLKELSVRDRKTVILVTHDPEAAAIADRIVTLRDGCVSSRAPHGAEEADAASPGRDAEGRAVSEEAKASSPGSDDRSQRAEVHPQAEDAGTETSTLRVDPEGGDTHA